MTTERTATAQVEVEVDPHTAFRVFTEEMDRWWVQGPINFWDSARAISLRCEPGVGGRVLEVYDEATGEGLELGRITVWQPGELLAWNSSVDDVETTVRFIPVEAGTKVVVEAYIPEGGRDEGGSAWVRVAPSWFSTWCARRDTTSVQPALSRLALTVSYKKPATAANWLNTVIGLEPSLPLPTDDETDHVWIEFRVGDGLLVVLDGGEDGGASASQTHIPWVFVDDLDAHHANAHAAGAKIVHDIHGHGYRAYELEDPEGHHWTIAQALPSMRQPA